MLFRATTAGFSGVDLYSRKVSGFVTQYSGARGEVNWLSCDFCNSSLCEMSQFIKKMLPCLLNGSAQGQLRLQKSVSTDALARKPIKKLQKS